MGSSLSDIPGAGGDKGRRRRGGGGDKGPSRPWRPLPRSSISERSARGRPTPRFTPRVEIDRVNLLLAASFAVILAIGAVWLFQANRVTLSIAGVEDGGSITTAAAESIVLDFGVDPTSRLPGTTLELDGEDISDEVERTDTALRWSPNPADPLGEGEYAFTVRAPRAVAGTATRTFNLSVDDTDPVLDVDEVEPAGLDETAVLAGSVDEEVELVVGGEAASVDDDGSFRVVFDVVPAGVVDVVATDPAGNATSEQVVMPVRYPGTHAIHLGADSWANESIRAAVLDQIGESFDAVVLDLKDECGLLGGDTDIELAGQIGAATDRYDLSDAASAIQDAGGRAIARIVAFRDPVLTAWGWSNGHPEWVLQDTSSSPWPDFTAPEGCVDPGRALPLGGGAAAFADPDVQDYVLAVVEAATVAGFDDVLLDDVRRPSGDLANLKLAVAPASAEGEDGEAAEPDGEGPETDDPVAVALTGFLRRARAVARAEGAYLGATASGLSVRDPSVYSQDLAQFATAVDYIAPEVYPESFSEGFFNLDSPINAPGQAVAGALQEARDQVGERPIELVPWIQDYSGAVVYGAAEVQAQVDGAAEAGSCSFIREDPDRNYTAGIEAAC